ncbi:glutathione peroxidase-like [Atheta coriaria]|uniref:glutathione peroxidase-like n=1 Tax=Dalotia coriaria TaxID=877792 RepID=UPI0031F4068A
MSQRVTRSAAAAGGKKPTLELPMEAKKVSKPKKTPTAKATKKAEETQKTAAIPENGDKAADDSIYAFTANDIKGTPVSLDKYKGHVSIIVNVASRCGHTKINYQQLVDLYEKYAGDKGLKILAFPCNQFGAQEPGTPEAICKFVEKYNVKFDMFEKINVNGPNAHPLYKFLSSKLPDPKGKGDKIKWNFTKFIIDADGKPVERFTPATKPITLVETLNKYW